MASEFQGKGNNQLNSKLGKERYKKRERRIEANGTSLARGRKLIIRTAVVGMMAPRKLVRKYDV
jgi:hypothetical protein